LRLIDLTKAVESTDRLSQPAILAHQGAPELAQLPGVQAQLARHFDLLMRELVALASVDPDLKSVGYLSARHNDSQIGQLHAVVSKSSHRFFGAASVATQVARENADGAGRTERAGQKAPLPQGLRVGAVEKWAPSLEKPHIFAPPQLQIARP
jgi:hypothetical protein